MPFRSVGDEMHEFKHGQLHSGSKHGPIVKSRKQAIAIALSEARGAGEEIPKPKKKKPALGAAFGAASYKMQR